jgi:hypothetical protein
MWVDREVRGESEKREDIEGVDNRQVDTLL